MELPQEFHEYRFDWLPDRVEFFFDGMLMLTNNQSIPDAAGTLALGHFEDDGLFSFTSARRCHDSRVREGLLQYNDSW